MAIAPLNPSPAQIGRIHRSGLRKALASATDTSAGLGEALRDYASDELHRAVECLTWRHARLHRGIHQARKSLRRVRASLALVAPVFGRSGELVDEELRRVNKSLSELRDGQALVEALDRLAAAVSANAPLLRRVRRAAAQRRAGLGRRYASADPGGDALLLATLLAALQALPWSRVRAADILAALERCTRRERDASERALRGDNAMDWHRWRRRARRLTQQDRALHWSPLPPRTVDEQRKTLAVLLGEVQDFSLLVEHCGAGSPFGSADRRRLRELSVHEIRQRRAYLREMASLITPPANSHGPPPVTSGRRS